MNVSPTTVAEWNKRFQLPGVAEIVAGEGGLPAIHVTTPTASATIYLYGAQVTAWQPAGAEEVLFLSRRSRFEAGRAIRGGIPVCFPWFRAKQDDPQAPAHGVVRTKVWELTSVEQHGANVRVSLATKSDDETRRWWPYEFTLEHHITVGSELRLELVVTNPGDAPMQIEQALHTYHRVGDIHQVYVEGLDGVPYLDNMDANRAKVQRGPVRFAAQTDNAYLQTETNPELVDPVLRRRIRTTKAHSQSTVVWNPWSDGAATLTDLGEGEWQQMACVEASNILKDAVLVGPGERHSMVSTLAVLPIEHIAGA